MIISFYIHSMDDLLDSISIMENTIYIIDNG